MPDPTPTRTADTRETLTFKGDASADYEPLNQAIELEAGDYTLMWTAFGPSGNVPCGVTINLFDASGSEVGPTGGVTTLASQPANGVLPLLGLERGPYQLFIYVGCPWEVTIRPLGPPGR